MQIVLFLDIDGVLNGYRTSGSNRGIDSDKVALLGTVIQSFGAKIILSSTWRNMGFGPDSVYGQCLRGSSPYRYWSKIVQDATIGMTPLEDNGPEERDVTIRRWIKANGEPLLWVAIDDLECISRLGEHHSVITNGMTGLTNDDIAKLIGKLRLQFASYFKV